MENKIISRWSFISCELIGTVMSIDLSVRNLKYFKTDDDTELVLINYMDGKQKSLNITGDSLAEIAIKVIQNI